jgi:hypothetical protein
MITSGVQRQSMRAANIPTPEFRPVSTAITQADIARLAGEVAFPAFLNLRRGRGGRNTVLLPGAGARWD